MAVRNCEMLKTLFNRHTEGFCPKYFGQDHDFELKQIVSYENTGKIVDMSVISKANSKKLPK